MRWILLIFVTLATGVVLFIGALNEQYAGSTQLELLKQRYTKKHRPSVERNTPDFFGSWRYSSLGLANCVNLSILVSQWLHGMGTQR